MINTPKVLILFVHGFLGSETSFASFPADLLQSLKDHFSVTNLEARVLPRFASKGNVDLVVNSLYNYLVLNCCQPEYTGVIILAHSMGGLISVDAFRKILALNNASVPVAVDNEDKIDKEEKSDVAGSALDNEIFEIEALPVKEGNEDWGGTQQNQQKHKSTTSIRAPKLNILGILCYDAPFFGLKSNDITGDVGSRIAEYLPIQAVYYPLSAISLVGNAVKATPGAVIDSVRASIAGIPSVYHTGVSTISDIPAAVSYGVQSIPSIVSQSASLVGGLPNSAYNAISTGWKAASTSIQYGGELVAATPAAIAQAVTIPTYLNFNHTTSSATPTFEIKQEIGEISHHPQETNYTGLISLGLTTAMLAGGVYYGGAMIAGTGALYARRALIAYVISNAGIFWFTLDEVRKHVQFLYPLWGEFTSEAEARMSLISDLVHLGKFTFKCFFIKNERRDSKDSLSSSFINLPPVKYETLFHPIRSDYEDTIAAHMGMFSRIENSYYWGLIDQSVLEIRRILNSII